MREIQRAQAVSKALIKRGQTRPQQSTRRAPKEKMHLCHRKAAPGSGFPTSRTVESHRVSLRGPHRWALAQQPPQSKTKDLDCKHCQSWCLGRVTLSASSASALQVARALQTLCLQGNHARRPWAPGVGRAEGSPPGSGVRSLQLWIPGRQA